MNTIHYRKLAFMAYTYDILLSSGRVRVHVLMNTIHPLLVYKKYFKLPRRKKNALASDHFTTSGTIRLVFYGCNYIHVAAVDYLHVHRYIDLYVLNYERNSLKSASHTY